MPFCPNCGAQYDAGAKFCEDCGTPFVTAPAEPVAAPVNDESKYAPPSYEAPQPQSAYQPVAQPQPAPSYNAQPQYQAEPQQSTDALCIAGFICSLLLSGLLGLILSIAGINRAKKSGAPGKGFGVAGIIISIFKLFMILIFAGSILFVGVIAYLDEASSAAAKSKKSKYEEPRQAIELIIDDYER